jgi:hypothetical protein
MTAKREAREIKKRILLKGRKRHIGAGDFAALLSGLQQAVLNPKVGFNHATTDLDGWLRSLAPAGISLDEAFIEDMLYACNMLHELGKFQHPLNKNFDEMLKSILGVTDSFDKDTNTIVSKRGK